MSEERPDDPPSGRWHVEKGIPIALIITLGLAFTVQTFTFGYMAAGYSARLDQVEKMQLALSTHIERMQQSTGPYVERIIRLETKVEGIADRLVEIRNILQARETRP